MRITRSLRLTAAAAASTVIATAALAGPFVGDAFAAANRKQPAPTPTLNASVPTGYKLVTGTHRTNSKTLTVSWTPIIGETQTCLVDAVKVTTGCSTGSVTTAPQADGLHTFTLKVKAGSTTRPATTSYSWTVDTAAPTQPTVFSVTSPTKNPTVTVNWQDTDADVAAYQCALVRDSVVVDGPADCTGPVLTSGSKTWSSLTDDGASGAASYQAEIWAVDSVGNPTPLTLVTPGSTSWSVDQNAPSSPVFVSTSLPSNPTHSPSANFQWTDSDFGGGPVTSFVCKLNGVVLGSCDPGGTSVTPGDGSHVFSVQGVDSAGNHGDATSYGWTIDTVAPPAPGITSGPATPVTDESDATFVFGDAELGVSYLCAVATTTSAPGTYNACSSGQPYTLPDGSYEFDLKAVDAAGNASAATSYRWTIDSSVTSPVALSAPSFRSGPSPYSNDLDPAFTWMDIDQTSGLHDECRLDAGAWATCNTGDRFAVAPPDGPYTLSLRTADAGDANTSPVVAWTWNLDTGAPTAPAFSSKPAGISNSTSAFFSFASDPNATFTCVLDNGLETNCASPASFDGLAQGGHTFTVYAHDAAGNVSHTAYPWTIDTSAPPAPSFTRQPASLTKDDNPTIAWTDSDSTALASSTCQLSFNGGAPVDLVTCDPSGTPVGPLAQDGDYSFSVTVTEGGHTALNSATWTQDTTAPVLVVNDVPASGTYSSATSVTPNVSQIDAHGGAIECAIDGGTLAPCATYSLADGSHTLTVTTTDLAGNHSTDSEFTSSWVVDSVAPALAVDVSHDVSSTGFNNTGVVSPVITFSDANPDTTNFAPDGYSCTLTKDGVDTGLGCGSYPIFTDGVYVLTADATDLAGNSATEVSKSWTVDTHAPTLDVAGIADGDITNVNNVSVTITQPGEVNANPPVCTLAGPSPSTTCGPYTGLLDGAYTLTVDTTDEAGNPAQTQTVHFTIDSQAPNLSMTGVPDGPTNVKNITPVINGDGGTVTCLLTGPSAAADCGPYTDLVDGAYLLTVHDVDAAGNLATLNMSFTVDTVSPTARTAAPATLTGAATITWSEPVSRLDLTKVALKETNSGKAVAATVTCQATGAAVPCTGTVGSLKVTPKSRLVPGQYYTVAIASGAAQDVASNPSTAVNGSFRAQRTLEERTAAAYAWQKVNTRSAYGKSYVRAHLAGATAAYTFRGASITWTTVTGPTMGKAVVLIDGKVKATVNNYATATHFKVNRTYKRLGNRQHTITVRALGVKGAKAGTGTYVAIDAMSVGVKRFVSPKLATTWKVLSSTKFFARHAVVSDLAGATMTLTFRGTSFAWYTVIGRNQGRAQIFVDGVRKATVDNYGASKYRVRRLVSHLPNTVHTVRIVVLGKHHKGGRGNLVEFDRFVIG